VQADSALPAAKPAGGKKDAMSEARTLVQANPTRSTRRVMNATQFQYPYAATLTKNEVCTCIEDTGLIPAVNEVSIEDALFVADTLLDAGIPVLEISMNAPDAIEIISHVVKHAPATIVGGGSLRNAEAARKCLDAGAKFLATDGLIAGVVELAAREKIVAVQGALTLTEVISAWDAGADFVKVVPCYAVGGPNYIRTLKAALLQARLIAAGGVNQVTAQNYIAAGAIGLSVGKELIPTEAIVLRQSRRIQELARRFLTAVDNGRE
jgi:2-dehydro-3-deoxyphosphogluconate aldolase/(4S)-4-hydroxy-2-oxoglutarate aldolase